MDLPTYIRNPDNAMEAEENYHEEMNQTLRQNVGLTGFAITPITDVDLTTTPVLDPNTGLFTTVQDLMPVGTIWAVVDAYEPDTTSCVYVGKNASGPTVLVQFDTSPYP